jgi:hypothetical protein
MSEQWLVLGDGQKRTLERPARCVLHLSGVRLS